MIINIEQSRCCLAPCIMLCHNDIIRHVCISPYSNSEKVRGSSCAIQSKYSDQRTVFHLPFSTHSRSKQKNATTTSHDPLCAIFSIVSRSTVKILQNSFSFPFSIWRDPNNHYLHVEAVALSMSVARASFSFGFDILHNHA